MFFLLFFLCSFLLRRCYYLSCELSPTALSLGDSRGCLSALLLIVSLPLAVGTLLYQEVTAWRQVYRVFPHFAKIPKWYHDFSSVTDKSFLQVRFLLSSRKFHNCIGTTFSLVLQRNFMIPQLCLRLSQKCLPTYSSQTLWKIRNSGPIFHSRTILWRYDELSWQRVIKYAK